MRVSIVTREGFHRLSHLKAPIPVSGPSVPSDTVLEPLKDDLASLTAFSMKSSVILRVGCSLNTEFMRAILAELRLASALVGQFWKLPKQLPPGSVT